MGYRPRNRVSNHSFILYAAECACGWRVIRLVSGSKGDAMVAAGQWREVYDEQDCHIGYQICSAGTSNSASVSNSPTSSGIPAHEMRVNAGLTGKSRTSGLPDDKRLSRRSRTTGAVLPEEDVVERIQAKVRVYPLIGGANGDILRAWPK